MGLGAELGERPLLVHRLDRDTSGVIVIAKRRSIAAALGKLFATRAVKKTYWAVVKGVPKPAQGRIEVALIKAKGPEGDRMRASRTGEEEDEQRAVTFYSVLDKARQSPPGCRSSRSPAASTSSAPTWPISARRSWATRNMAALDDMPEGMDRKLHLHARRIVFPHPREGTIDISAPCRSTCCELRAVRLRRQPLRGGRRVKLAIFDVDGTLVDSSAMIAASLTTAFRAEGLPVPERTRMMSHRRPLAARCHEGARAGAGPRHA